MPYLKTPVGIESGVKDNGFLYSEGRHLVLPKLEPAALREGSLWERRDTGLFHLAAGQVIKMQRKGSAFSAYLPFENLDAF